MRGSYLVADNLGGKKKVRMKVVQKNGNSLRPKYSFRGTYGFESVK